MEYFKVEMIVSRTRNVSYMNKENTVIIYNNNQNYENFYNKDKMN